MGATPASEIKVVGKSGQISLGKRYAGKMLELQRLDDGTLLLRAVAMVPESQLSGHSMSLIVRESHAGWRGRPRTGPANQTRARW